MILNSMLILITVGYKNEKKKCFLIEHISGSQQHHNTPLVCDFFLWLLITFS